MKQQREKVALVAVVVVVALLLVSSSSTPTLAQSFPSLTSPFLAVADPSKKEREREKFT